MRLFGPLIAPVMIGVPALGSPAVAAIGAINTWCFKAGQTTDKARTNMQRSAGIALIKTRALLRQRGTVVHVNGCKANTRNQTFMSVDRLYDGLGLSG